MGMVEYGDPLWSRVLVKYRDTLYVARPTPMGWKCGRCHHGVLRFKRSAKGRLASIPCKVCGAVVFETRYETNYE